MTLKEPAHQLNHLLEHSGELRALVGDALPQRAAGPQEPGLESDSPQRGNREQESERLPAQDKPLAESVGPSRASPGGQTQQSQPLYFSEEYPHGSHRWRKI